MAKTLTRPEKLEMLTKFIRGFVGFKKVLEKVIVVLDQAIEKVEEFDDYAHVGSFPVAVYGNFRCNDEGLMLWESSDGQQIPICKFEEIEGAELECFSLNYRYQPENETE